MVSFGQTITKHRQLMGLTQKALAAKVSLSPQYMNDIEKDNRSPTSPALLDDLAKALHIAPEILYFKAGRLMPDCYRVEATAERIAAAYEAFRRVLRG